MALLTLNFGAVRCSRRWLAGYSRRVFFGWRAFLGLSVVRVVKRMITHAAHKKLPMLRIVLFNIIITLSCLGICCRAWMIAAPSPSSSSSRHTNIHIMKKQQSDEDELSSLPTIPPRPPMTFRDESSFVLAGDVPSSESSPMIRQSPSSTNPLLSPPRKVSNPYGWMRDESRTNETILNHLHAENEYCDRMMSHLEELREELYLDVSK